MLAVPAAYATVGMAEIKGTKEDSAVSGKLRIIEKDDGIDVEVEVEHVPDPGRHGLHFHEIGRCDDEGKAAGGHFNPEKAQHGYLPKDGRMHAHAGDMGNIEIGPDGRGSLKVFLPGVFLSKTPGVGGLSIVLHEKEDDFGQPTGNAGGRIGCGVIELKESPEQLPDMKSDDMDEKETEPKANTAVPPEMDHTDPSHPTEPK